MLSIRRILQRKEIVLLFSAGLFLLALLDSLMVQGFYKDEHYRETLMAERLQAQVQSSLEEHVTALIALKVVYQNFTDINHYDFQQYGKSITASIRGFQRLFYIDPTMTIRQVYPMTPENKGLYGYSLKNEALLAQTMQQAKSAPNPTTSRLLPFLNHPKSFWAFIPIYRGKEFLGFAAGEISLERIWQPFASTLSKYQMQLIDPTGTKLFQQVNINPKSPTVSQLPFHVGGQRWTLHINPVNPPSETLLLQRGSLWTGGLLILFLLAFIMLDSKRHKSELEEAQKQFETIFEASPDGLMLLDERLHPRISNPVMRAWLGRTEAQLAEQSFFDLFQCQCPNLHKCQELKFLLCTSEQFAVDLPEVLEAQMIDPPEGQPTTLRLNASKIVQERDGQRQEGFICVLGDISTIKELERVKETYVATLTHDLKTPLLAQQMVLESLSTGSLGPVNSEQHRLLLGARDSVQDLLDMVNITLLFYKLESPHTELNRHRLPLTSVIREAMHSLQPLADKKGSKLELETALELPDSWIDTIQMKRVFQNLISNAIHYGQKGTPIRISVQAQQDGPTGSAESLLVVISNQGKGIAPEDLPRIFDKYYSLSRKFKQIGTGLGLYISRRIVELHGGKIWAESQPGEITQFFISLPCIEQTERDANRVESPAAAQG